jgi:hypothetical protein
MPDHLKWSAIIAAVVLFTVFRCRLRESPDHFGPDGNSVTSPA